MTGTVDDRLRALLPITILHPTTENVANWEAWIDTAFTGDLAVPRSLLAPLQLPAALAVEAILADGSRVKVNTYIAELEWFGQREQIEIVANESQHPLLGLGLLNDRKLTIDYSAGTVTLD